MFWSGILSGLSIHDSNDEAGVGFAREFSLLCSSHNDYA